MMMSMPADVCALKQQRAKSRARDLSAKRAEYQRAQTREARSVPRSRSSAPADRVKPHRLARAATRSFVSKGLVQGEADVPSITSMERSTSAHARKKPSVAAMVNCGVNQLQEQPSKAFNECSEAEVEAFLGKKNIKKQVVRIPGLAPPAPKGPCAAERSPASSDCGTEERVAPHAVKEALQATKQSGEEIMATPEAESGLDFCALKMSRAASRKRHMAAKRVEYQRARSTQRARSSDPADRVKPHRIARTAARSFVAKGFVESESDMPSLTSMGRSTSAHARKKPSVASLVHCGGAPCLEKSVFVLEDVSDFETTASEGEDFVEASPAERTAGASDVDSVEESEHAMIDKRSEDCEAPHRDEQQQQQQQQFADTELKQKADVEDRDGETKPGQSNEAPTRREQVLRKLVDQLRAQSKEEEGRANEAKAQREALEEQLRLVEGKASKTSKSQEKKAALQLEKRQAAEMRKRRNQEQQLRHLKEKADEALQAAEKMREEAEAEAIAAKARHLAEAEVVAQREAEAFALAEAESVRVQTEELVQQRMHELAQAQAALEASAAAEAESLKAQAESEARNVQVLAEQMKVRVQQETHSMKIRAEVESRVIKARAEMEARDLKAAMEAERRAHLEAQAQEQAQADARAKAELAAQEEAAREAQKRVDLAAQKEASAALKRAKELEQQRAKQFRKQQQQERKLAEAKERELEAARAKAKQESDALLAKALAEAKAVKANAEAEARAIRARAEAEALAKVVEESKAEVQAEGQQALAGTEQQAEQIAHEDAHGEHVPNEAEAEGEFAGGLLDFEVQDEEGAADEDMHEEEATGITKQQPEESGWEVLPTEDSRSSTSQGSSKRWWNIFF
mmetsp:Transcript_8762/g.24056  ORF Transcript_8762/g.24056 Transcript_8762/m.24056 type:complete len:862 (+) Transcript_8762:81-2666(+)